MSRASLHAPLLSAARKDFARVASFPRRQSSTGSHVPVLRLRKRMPGFARSPLSCEEGRQQVGTWKWQLGGNL